MGSGEWTEFHQLGRKIQAGCVVCGQLVVWAGFEDYFDDGFECYSEGRDYCGWGGDHAGIYASRKVAKVQR